MSDDDLNAKLKAAAEKVVGGKALTSKYGIDCFGLVDKLLRDLGGKSAGDFGTLTKDADYDWGDGIMLDSIQPGDILQFRNHVVHSSTLQRLDNGTWFETEESTARARTTPRSFSTSARTAASPSSNRTSGQTPRRSGAASSQSWMRGRTRAGSTKTTRSS